MNNEELKGGAERWAARSKSSLARVTGNPVTEQKGREEQVEGHPRQTAGKIKGAVEHSSKH